MTHINIQDSRHASEFIINFMFSGEYLDQNIGHEIINLYMSDSTENKEGEHYVYLCQDGLFNPDNHPNVQRIFFVRRTGNSGEMEILGFTDGTLEYILPQIIEETEIVKGTTQKVQKVVDSEEVNRIYYGGVSVGDIFKENSEQQSINVTFKAERVLRPQEPLYIHLRENGADNKKIFNASRNLRTYIHAEEDKEAYAYLTQKIVDITPENAKPITSISKEEVNIKATTTEIYGIQNYELAYSNALKFFIDNYSDDFKEFFAQISKSGKLGSYIQTLREWKNIDLIVEFENAVFVIENKILSGLNGICKDKGFDYNQLDKYQGIILRTEKESPAEKEENDHISFLNKKNQFFFVLTPNHNDLDLGEHKKIWTTIFYNRLYDFFKNKKFQENGTYNEEFKDFLDSISYHCDKDYNYSIMRKRFVRAINNAKENNRLINKNEAHHKEVIL